MEPRPIDHPINLVKNTKAEDMILVPPCVCGNQTRSVINEKEIITIDGSQLKRITMDHGDHYQKLFIIKVNNLLFQLIIPKANIENELVTIWTKQSYISLQPYERAKIESMIYEVLSMLLRHMDNKDMEDKSVKRKIFSIGEYYKLPWKLFSELMNIHDLIWEQRQENSISIVDALELINNKKKMIMVIQELIRRGTVIYDIDKDTFKIKREDVIKDNSQDFMDDWYHLAVRNFDLWD